MTTDKVGLDDALQQARARVDRAALALAEATDRTGAKLAADRVAIHHGRDRKGERREAHFRRPALADLIERIEDLAAARAALKRLGGIEAP